MQKYWSAFYTKSQTINYLCAIGCEEDLPKANRALWICPPGQDATTSCVTKTRQKGTDGKLLYRIDLYRQCHLLP